MAVDYGSLPFAEALEFLRQKLNLPTQAWDDLLGAAHDRAFVVAGATAADLLADLHAAVEKAIAQGTTLATFRQDFERIVAERGWTGWFGEDTKAGRAWRTWVIYETNLFTSYSAGRYQQLKEVAAARPWWRYRHSDASVKAREEHLAWDGVIRRHDDAWWNTHYPPSGFGCRCYIESLSDREMKKFGLAETPADDIPFNGTVNGIDPKTGEAFERPEGVDKGWDYAPGKSYADVLAKLKKLEAEKVAQLNDSLEPYSVRIEAIRAKAVDMAFKRAGSFDKRAVLAKVDAGLVPGDRLALRNQVITYLGDHNVKVEKDGKVVREGRMTSAELDDLLAAIAASVGRKSLT